jgi:hypothetical protein
MRHDRFSSVVRSPWEKTVQLESLVMNEVAEREPHGEIYSVSGRVFRVSSE